MQFRNDFSNPVPTRFCMTVLTVFTFSASQYFRITENLLTALSGRLM